MADFAFFAIAKARKTWRNVAIKAREKSWQTPGNGDNQTVMDNDS